VRAESTNRHDLGAAIIMTTLAINLVQHWQIPDNQAVLTISFKNYMINVWMKLFEGHIVILDSDRWIKTNDSYTQQ
jgi:hypothetical protein